jgi:hypothetical protein
MGNGLHDGWRLIITWNAPKISGGFAVEIGFKVPRVPVEGEELVYNSHLYLVNKVKWDYSEQVVTLDILRL